jgi:uncharacterized membrane protein
VQPENLTPDTGDNPGKKTPEWLRKLRAHLLTGLLVLGPIVLTLWIIVNLFLFADSLLGRPIRYFLGSVLDIHFFAQQSVHGIGLIALILLILITGWFARMYLGGRIVKFVNGLIERIPLINKIYNATLQISEALLGGQREVFKYAVLIEYPKKDVYSIGFVTQDTKGAVQESIDGDVISVFIPTTPNPTSGYLLFVPKMDVTFLDLSVEEALKLVISAGAVVPRKGGGSRQAAERLGIRTRPVMPGQTDSA